MGGGRREACGIFQEYSTAYEGCPRHQHIPRNILGNIISAWPAPDNIPQISRKCLIAFLILAATTWYGVWPGRVSVPTHTPLGSQYALGARKLNKEYDFLHRRSVSWSIYSSGTRALDIILSDNVR